MWHLNNLQRGNFEPFSFLTREEFPHPIKTGKLLREKVHSCLMIMLLLLPGRNIFPDKKIINEKILMYPVAFSIRPNELSTGNETFLLII
jgi:hypothetical protein